MPQHHHAQGIANQQDVDAGPVQMARHGVVVGGEHGDALSAAFHLRQARGHDLPHHGRVTFSPSPIVAPLAPCKASQASDIRPGDLELVPHCGPARFRGVACLECILPARLATHSPDADPAGDRSAHCTSRADREAAGPAGRSGAFRAVLVQELGD